MKTKIRVKKSTKKETKKIFNIADKESFKKDGSGSLIPLAMHTIETLVEDGNFYSGYYEDKFAGCVSLIEYNGMVELRSLVVKEKYREKGISSRLIEKCKKEAEKRGYNRLYALIKENNYGLFKKHEFYQAEKPPQKLERDCNKCPTYGDCKEEAFVYEIKKP